MAKTSSPAQEPEGRYNLRSDGEPGIHGHLGCFRRGPAVFSLYAIPPDQSRYPNTPAYYLLDCDDGAGPHEVCRIEADAMDEPFWNGAWKNDPWCLWLLKQVRALIAAPQDD
ncbi:hypothetical protein O1R50_03330 [Glycomyces luteolus]|uniref:Uncharacterized protein n=1 Tax=Glycomyces luteolus TaxID=2670330 RepID=A0A9X3P7S9_9ACTN|nr:hypothetical protein [Glycomyces luteolus]MDA1358637.1 hypothetical protein [Glycomyces luteolus]